jgi:lysyl-tRNA synthetase class I
MKNRIRLFESWLAEAKTEASPEEIKDLLNLLVPIIKKSVDDTMRFEMDYAKKLADAKNDNQRSRLFIELNQKREDAEEPIEFFLNSKGKVSQSQMQKILSWSQTMKGLLLNKEFSTKQEEFKNLGVDVSRWKEMYDPAKISNDILMKNRDFEKEMGIKPPLITG